MSATCPICKGTRLEVETVGRLSADGGVDVVWCLDCRKVALPERGTLYRYHPVGKRKLMHQEWLVFNIARAQRIEVEGSRLKVYVEEGVHVSDWPDQDYLWSWLRSRPALVGCPLNWDGFETLYKVSKQLPGEWSE